MTESKTENQPADTHAAAQSKTSTGGAGSQPPAARKPSGKKKSFAPVALVVVLLIAIALAAGLWYQDRNYRSAQDQLTRQAQSSASAAQQASGQAGQALALAQSHDEQLKQLHALLAESQEQVHGLEQALQMLTDRGSDLAIVNDVDHLVSIAHQQLLLTGNVSNAIIALETAQAQLARANRPALAPLQQAINGDLDRLRAASTIDINLLSARLDELAGLVASAPLLVPDDAAPALAHDAPRQAIDPVTPEKAAATPGQADAPWWREGLVQVQDWSAQTWASVRRDLGDFISVRKVDDAAALLMSPDQAGRLRDNLRLRVMTARLALLMNQTEIWKSETSAIVKILETRFDEHSSESRRAIRLARQLADTQLEVRLPTVQNSIQTLEALRESAQQPEGAEEGAASSVVKPDPTPAASAPAAAASPSLVPAAAPVQSQE